MRVVHEQNGVRKVVSHFNKATKGRIPPVGLRSHPARALALVYTLRDLGQTVEPDGNRLDVVFTEI